MDDTTQKKAIIIGAGIAGLSLAVRLQSKGIQVSVFEANKYPGGKLTELSKKGYRFDMGPSLFTMPQFVEELFSISNKNINHYFSYKKKETVCHYFYKDGTFFKASSNLSEQNIILAGDTLVLLGGEILGKPKDMEEARTMIQQLSGTTHQVLTAYAILDGFNGEELVELAST